MHDDEFQKKLQSQPRRTIPSEWRAQILAAAREATPEPDATPRFAEWLWPFPQAWAGLAAVWMAIVVLQSQSGIPGRSAAEAGRRTTSIQRIALAERQREFWEVLDMLAPVAVEEKKLRPGPRGEIATHIRIA